MLHFSSSFFLLVNLFTISVLLNAPMTIFIGEAAWHNWVGSNKSCGLAVGKCPRCAQKWCTPQTENSKWTIDAFGWAVQMKSGYKYLYLRIKHFSYFIQHSIKKTWDIGIRWPSWYTLLACITVQSSKVSHLMHVQELYSIHHYHD